MKALMTSQVGIFRKESDLLSAKEKDQGIERKIEARWYQAEGHGFQLRVHPIS